MTEFYVENGQLLSREVKKQKTSQKANNNETVRDKTDNRRSRRFSCITYIDPERLRVFLGGASWVQHFAYIHHDCDVWSDDDEQQDEKHVAGMAKEKHSHVILYTYDGKSSSAIRKLFDRYSEEVYGKDEKQNTQVQICNDIVAQYRYLIHADDPDKYQYSPSLRHVDELAYWNRLCETEGLNDSGNNSGMAMVQDMMDGVPFRTMCERYGKDFIYHAKYVSDMASFIRNEESGSPAVLDDTMIKLILDSSNYYQSDILKFFEMLNYVKKQFSMAYCRKPDFSLYLGADKNNND